MDGLFSLSFLYCFFIRLFHSTTKAFRRRDLLCSYPGHLLTVHQLDAYWQQLPGMERLIINTVQISRTVCLRFFL